MYNIKINELKFFLYLRNSIKKTLRIFNYFTYSSFILIYNIFCFHIWYGIVRRHIFSISYFPPISPKVFFAMTDDEKERFAESMRPYYIYAPEYFNLEMSIDLKRHNFHMVEPSPWPFYISFSVLSLALGFIGSLHNSKHSFELLISGFIMTVLIFSFWCKDIISEGTYQGKHTYKVQRNLRIGFTLFIVSEIMLFLSFFWAFFHFSLAPAIEIGGVWPPFYFSLIYPYGVPLLNTIILVISGGSLTWVHIIVSKRINYSILDLLTRIYYIIKAKLQEYLNRIYNNNFFFPFVITLLLAFLFTFLQEEEYADAPFSINDSVFGSVFFMTTGLHGLHVIIGTLFISVGFIRFFLKHFTAKHHIGFETSAWYWHFVDVVWILLFFLYYVWSYRDAAILLFNSIRHNIQLAKEAYEAYNK